jgi:hypothetical protein
VHGDQANIHKLSSTAYSTDTHTLTPCNCDQIIASPLGSPPAPGVTSGKAPPLHQRDSRENQGKIPDLHQRITHTHTLSHINQQTTGTILNNSPY